MACLGSMWWLRFVSSILCHRKSCLSAVNVKSRHHLNPPVILYRRCHTEHDVHVYDGVHMSDITLVDISTQSKPLCLLPTVYSLQWERASDIPYLCTEYAENQTHQHLSSRHGINKAQIVFFLFSSYKYVIKECDCFSNVWHISSPLVLIWLQCESSLSCFKGAVYRI